MTLPIFHQAVCQGEESPLRGLPVVVSSRNERCYPFTTSTHFPPLVHPQLRPPWLSEIFLLKHLHTQTFYHLARTNVCTSKPAERVLQRVHILIFLFLWGKREGTAILLKNGLNQMLSLQDDDFFLNVWYVKNLFNKRRAGWVGSPVRGKHRH